VAWHFAILFNILHGCKNGVFHKLQWTNPTLVPRSESFSETIEFDADNVFDTTVIASALILLAFLKMRSGTYLSTHGDREADVLPRILSVGNRSEVRRFIDELATL
jgi:hypothetical protein